MLAELKKFKDNTLFLCENGISISYNAVYDLFLSLTERIGRGKLILLIASNELGSLLYYVSLLNTENYILIVSQNTHLDLLSRYLESYHPDYICCPINMENMFGESIQKLEETFSYGVYLYDIDFEKRINKNLAILLSTSGTTGNQKIVRISRDNLLANAQSIIQYLQITQEDRPIMSLPMSYSYGLSIIHTHILQGATILLPSSPIYKKSFWTFFQENKGTSFSGVLYSYEIIDKMGIFNMNMPHLTCLTQAGGKLSETLQKKYAKYAREHNIKFFIMYGQTEATARMTYLPYDIFWTGEKINSVGIPIPGTHINLVDKNHDEINEPYKKGEILFNGKNVSWGYAENYRDLERGNDNNYTLNTGDVAYMDEDGYYYICGRKNRFIKLLGNRINLDDIESLVKSNFHDLHCAVTGNDKKIIVWIEEELSIEVKGYLCNVLHCNGSLIDIQYIKKIPRCASGKILYSEIERKYH